MTYEASSVLFRMTNGHLGFVSRTLYLLLSREYHDSAAMISFFLSYSYIRDLAQMRGVPDYKRMTATQLDICKRLCFTDGLLLDDILSKTELASVEQLNSGGAIVIHDEEMRPAYISFSSPIVEYVTIHRLFPDDVPSDDLVSNLDDLLYNALLRFRPSLLLNSKGVGIGNVLLERTWQVELYRSDFPPQGRYLYQR